MVPERVRQTGGPLANKPRSEKPVPVSKHEIRRIEAERRMLEAAVEILAKNGVEGLTLADVGSAAGYSRGLPTHYFGSKGGLLEAVARHVIDNFANRLAGVPESKPGISRLMRFIRVYLELDSKQRAGVSALQTLFAESLTEPGLVRAVSSHTKRTTSDLAEIFEVAISSGEIRREVDPHRHATIVLGTLRSIVALWLVDPRSIPLDRVTEALIASFGRELAG
jgi:AcrR family transcriptional regulator